MAIPAIQHLETKRLSPAVVGLQRWPLDVFAEKWSAFQKSLLRDVFVKAEKLIDDVPAYAKSRAPAA